ncbi:MFS transporter [Streptomyces sp. NBC_00249]|uniref:MFS transporter n=1 Tax=Streptomyces sp. NBC_00249 TaxID=2975690 RepID=UPI00225BBC85|nr:MFS transporter [Streptomyces sp. NBC_00249]MCX5192736.1 MFS transporter [Streptomyces sp. NBC_00249]
MTTRFLPPPGAPRRLAAAQLSNSVGDGAYYVCSALYFSRVAGLSPAQIGLGLTLAWAVGSVAGVPLGALADRRGPRGASVLLALATAASVASLLFVRSYGAFLCAVVLYAVSQCGLAAARQSLLAGLVAPGERTGVLAHLQATLNAGLALGAALGGLALGAGTERAYLVVLALDAVGFLVCAALLRGLPVVAPAPGRTAGEPRLAVLRDRPYALVTLLNAVLLLRMPLLSLALPLWVVQRTAAPGWLVSALFVLNTLAVTLFQVRLARPVRDLESAGRALRVSGLVTALSCAVFAAAALPGSGWAAAALLLVGALLLSDGEMRQSAGSWQIGFALAPAGRTGQYQGFFGTGVPLARTLGPALLTALLLLWGVPGWLLLGGLLLAASYAMGPAVRRARSTAGTGRAPDGGSGLAAGDLAPRAGAGPAA